MMTARTRHTLPRILIAIALLAAAPASHAQVFFGGRGAVVVAPPPVVVAPAPVVAPDPPVVVAAPQPSGFLLGEWVGAPCRMIFQQDDGRSVMGDCTTPAGVHHVFRGAYTSPNMIAGTFTRIDPLGCQITVAASFHIDDQNMVDFTLPPWYGCGLNGVGGATALPIRRAQPAWAYVADPFDFYLVNIVPTDIVFVNGNTYVWTTDASGHRTQQLYAAGDHRQQLIARSAQVHQVAARNGGHLPAAGAGGARPGPGGARPGPGGARPGPGGAARPFTGTPDHGVHPGSAPPPTHPGLPQRQPARPAPAPPPRRLPGR